MAPAAPSAGLGHELRHRAAHQTGSRV